MDEFAVITLPCFWCLRLRRLPARLPLFLALATTSLAARKVCMASTGCTVAARSNKPGTMIANVQYMLGLPYASVGFLPRRWTWNSFRLLRAAGLAPSFTHELNTYGPCLRTVFTGAVHITREHGRC